MSPGVWTRVAVGVLWVELVVGVVWAPVLVAGLYSAAALLGVWQALPGWAGVVAALVAWGVMVGLLVRAIGRARTPRLGDGERRLERDSGLSHRPFAVLRDVAVAGGDGALWQVHQARARAALQRLRLAGPRAGLAVRDRFALRALMVLGLVAGVAMAGPRWGNRLEAAWLPGVAGIGGGPAPVIQAWVEPPAYTGLAPLFLPLGGGRVEVPVGSRLTVSVTGRGRAPGLSLPGETGGFRDIGPQSFEAKGVVTQSGAVRVRGFWDDLADWTLVVLPNETPLVAWAELPGRAGTSLSTNLPWQVQQRWGVAHLQAEIKPAGHPELEALVIPLPLPGTPNAAHGAARPDLQANPYAGLKVTGRLVARDVSGQMGESAPAEFVLPARAFHHPLAKAIADLRRRLALHPDDPQAAADDLRALAQAPLEQKVAGLSATGVMLNMTTVAALLSPDMTHPERARAAIPEAQGRLWKLALALDGGLPEESARALAEAQEKLRQALEDHKQGKLSDKELAAKLQALREALQKQLNEIARQAQKQGALSQFDPNQQHLSSPAIDRLIDQLQKAIEQGRMADAAQIMKQLDQMMEQLKHAHVMTPQEQAQAQAARQQGQQRMGAVQDMVQREGKLLDHAEARSPQGRLPPVMPRLPGFLFQQPPEGPGSGGGTDEDAEEGMAAPPVVHDRVAVPQPQDARTQRALGRALAVLKEAVAAAGQKPPQNLDDASAAMADAVAALEARQDPEARDAIERAIAALQQGAQQMAHDMSQGSGGGMQLSLMPGGSPRAGENGEEEGEGSAGGGRRDPFGRQVDGDGKTMDDPALRVPDDAEQGRSRAILEELRRRGAERARPKGELDYIDRLLKPF